tara:strand:- start:226 stop:975 length:750 start_codon:yes stop_codon:yes gene_type:complete
MNYSENTNTFISKNLKEDSDTKNVVGKIKEEKVKEGGNISPMFPDNDIKKETDNIDGDPVNPMIVRYETYNKVEGEFNGEDSGWGDEEDEEDFDGNYGKLYCLEEMVTWKKKGEWIKKVIKSLSTLYCNFTKITNDLPNGIDIVSSNCSSSTYPEIGIELSSFLVRSYIMKRYKRVSLDNTETISYVSPVNLVLQSYDDNDINNNRLIQAIKTILNHPDFSSSSSMEDLLRKTSFIKNFNKRYNKKKNI